MQLFSKRFFSNSHRAFERALNDATIVHKTVVSASARENLRVADGILSARKSDYDKLVALIGDYPVEVFAIHKLQKAAEAKFDFDARSPQPEKLKDITKLGSVKHWSRYLTQQLFHLPYQYSIVVQLPQSATDALVVLHDKIIVNEHFKIMSGEALKDVGLTLDHPNSRVLDRLDLRRHLQTGERDIRASFDETQRYLVFQSTGFLSEYDDTEAQFQFLSNVRGYLGLAVALGVFSVSPYGLQGDCDPNYYVFRSFANSYEVEFSRQLEDETFSAMTQLRPHRDEGTFGVHIAERIEDRIAKI